jgi:hypothetical protein
VTAREDAARFAVVALLEVSEVGAVVERKRWPAHVTLVSNFVTTAPARDLAEVLRRHLAVDRPLVVDLGASAFFGHDETVPVRLVAPEAFSRIHEALVDALDATSRIIADEPSNWRDGYRPHLTLGPAVDPARVDGRVVREIALARLDADTATIVARWGLGPGLDA